RVLGARDVADGEDVRVRRAQARVDEHTVVDLQTGCAREVHVGRDPHADHDDVRVEHGAVAELDGPHAGRIAVRRTDRGDGDLEAQVDAVGAVQVGEHR